MSRIENNGFFSGIKDFLGMGRKNNAPVEDKRETYEVKDSFSKSDGVFADASKTMHKPAAGSQFGTEPGTISTIKKEPELKAKTLEFGSGITVREEKGQEEDDSVLKIFDKNVKEKQSNHVIIDKDTHDYKYIISDKNASEKEVPGHLTLPGEPYLGREIKDEKDMKKAIIENRNMREIIYEDGNITLEVPERGILDNCDPLTDRDGYFSAENGVSRYEIAPDGTVERKNCGWIKEDDKIPGLETPDGSIQTGFFHRPDMYLHGTVENVEIHPFVTRKQVND